MNIYALNTLETGLNKIDIIKKEIPLKGVIGLSRRNADNDISGYLYLGDYCKRNNLTFIETNSYQLSAAQDKERLLGLDIDLLLILGWQRLIPGWLIRHCKLGVIGIHGSASGITGGRGRSPMNWALMLNKGEFSLSIFRVAEGIDSGDIIDTKVFRIEETDDIKTAYYKIEWLAGHMIVENIKNGKIASGGSIKQTGEARYLPQRLPEDGEIDWSRSSKQLYDFVRALTRPYPGTFSFCSGAKVTIWRARPFELSYYAGPYRCGEIAKVYTNGDIMVKTGDTFLLVEDFEVEPADKRSSLIEGARLSSRDFNEQVAAIIQRHKQKYSELVLSDDILKMQSSKPARPE